MEAAKSLLADKGISGTNMIEIADRAQVSRASLYNHFRDKHEVFVALVANIRFGLRSTHNSPRFLPPM